MRAGARFVGVAFAAGVAATACLLSSPRSARAGEPLRVWHAYRGDEERVLTELVEKSGVAAELLGVPYDAYGSKLAAAIPVGEGPDVFIDAHERIGDYAHRGLVAPVDALLAETDAWVPTARAAVLGPGAEPEAYALPLSLKSLALFRNVALAPARPRSLGELLALRLPAGVFPLAYEASSAYSHAALLHGYGGALFANGTYAFAGEEAASSLTFARGLLVSKLIPEDADGALVKELFRSGRAAAVMSGPWFAAELGGSDVRWTVDPLPVLDETGRALQPFLTVESVFVSPKGAKKPEALALARALAGAAAATARAERLGAVPARSDARLPESPTLAAFAEQAKTAVPMPSDRRMRSAWEPAGRALRKVLRGDAEAHAALDEGRRRFVDVTQPLPERRSPTPLIVAVGVALLAAALAWLRRAKASAFAGELRRSLPAYAWVTHAALAVGALVVLPVAIGAATSLFAGSGDDVRYVGLSHFASILTARGGPLLATGSFYLVLLVTLLWTAVNLAGHLALGVSLGLLLHRPTLRLRALYRVLLIVPWAVPSYVTALSWKGMFHRQFGAIAGLTKALGRALGADLEPISWFSRFSTAFTANALTNVWLGFPFMMVVTLGALTSISNDVLEAAEVDGATRWQRLRRVVLPMLAPTLAPSVTLGAVWTFNMFNVVFLVSGGDPDGSTDILVSEAYRWAFTREAQYGYAAAYSVLIFLLLAGGTRLLRRREAEAAS